MPDDLASIDEGDEGDVGRIMKTCIYSIKSE